MSDKPPPKKKAQLLQDIFEAPPGHAELLRTLGITADVLRRAAPPEKREPPRKPPGGPK